MVVNIVNDFLRKSVTSIQSQWTRWRSFEALRKLKDVPTLQKWPPPDTALYARVLRVVDGDTIEVALFLQGKPHAFRVRLYGYDAPETRTKNDNEKALGLFCKKLLHNLIHGELVTLSTRRGAHGDAMDSFGRILAEVNVRLKIVGDININMWMLLNAPCIAYAEREKKDWDNMRLMFPEERCSKLLALAIALKGK